MNLSSCSAVVKERAICPWSALYASTAPSPGVHIQKRTLSVLNPFSVVRRALFVTITVVPVALMQSHLSNLGWQDLGPIIDWKMFLKIKTGNVRIFFPNDLRAVHSVPT